MTAVWDLEATSTYLDADLALGRKAVAEAQLRVYLGQNECKNPPTKMQPLGPQTDTDRLQHAKREIKALWTACNRLLCDLNTLTGRCTPSTNQPHTSKKKI